MTCKMRGEGWKIVWKMKWWEEDGEWRLCTPLRVSGNSRLGQTWGSVVVIAYHYIVLWDNWALGQRHPTVRTTDQSKLDSSGEGPCMSPAQVTWQIWNCQCSEYQGDMPSHGTHLKVYHLHSSQSTPGDRLHWLPLIRLSRYQGKDYTGNIEAFPWYPF